MRKKAIAAGLGLLLLVFYLFSGGSKEEQRSTVSLSPMPEHGNVDVSMSGVEMRLGQEGQTLWTLRAQSASYDQGQQTVLLNAPSIIKSLDGRDIPVIVNAPLGEVDQATSDIRLWSGVHMEYGPTYLNSQEAIFIQVDETIFMYGNILLDRQGLQMRSARGDVDLNTWVVNAEGGVEVVIAKQSLGQGL